MPAVEGSIVCRAPAVEVWRLVRDPARLHEWLADTERVEPGDEGDVVRYLHGWPEHPMPTRVRRDRGAGAVTISCLVSDIDLTVVLEPHPSGCRVALSVALPAVEAHRTERMAELVEASLARLADRAAQGGAAGLL